MLPLVEISLKAFLYHHLGLISSAHSIDALKNSLNLSLLEEGHSAYSSIRYTLTCSGFTASSSNHIPAQALCKGKHTYKSILLNRCWFHSCFLHYFLIVKGFCILPGGRSYCTILFRTTRCLAALLIPWKLACVVLFFDFCAVQRKAGWQKSLVLRSLVILVQ